MFSDAPQSSLLRLEHHACTAESIKQVDDFAVFVCFPKVSRPFPRKLPTQYNFLDGTIKHLLTLVHDDCKDTVMNATQPITKRHRIREKSPGIPQ